MTNRPIMNPVRPAPTRPIINVRPPPAAKLPTVTKLKNVLGAWKFHSPNHEIPWKSKKPAGAVAGSVVMQKAPRTAPGQTITAFVLKSDPTKVYYEMRNEGYRMPPPRPGLIMNPPPPSFFEPKYFGPVSTVAVPK